MILSILICTLPESEHFYNQMLGYLGPIPQGVEIVKDDRGRQTPTGQKRNELIEKAQGEYFVFVDCDDKVDPSYIPEILKALESKPDCVPIDGWYIDMVNNHYTLPWTMRLGERYEARGNHIYRWPNHLAVMKKSLVQHVKFPNIWKGEDFEWSKTINDGKFWEGSWISGPNRLLRTQEIIGKPLYTYLYNSNK
jgi:glycosyltransferase involved in cell wall biosynthesis